MLARIRRPGFRIAVGALAVAATASATLISAPAAVAAPSAGPSIPGAAASTLASEVNGAWQITRGEKVTVALLSTAVSPVSDLAGKLTIGPNYAPLAGADTVFGTLVASLIAGSGPTSSNALGAIGRAPGARILAIRVFDTGTSKAALHYDADGVWQPIAAKAIRYAVDHGAQVVVEMQSGTENSSDLDSAVQYAIDKNVVVIGSGVGFGDNPRSTTALYPDSLPGVINFSGVAIKGLPAPPQSVPFPANSSVLVTAPDNVLPATGPGNQTFEAFNTFTAIAWVAGTAALIKSVYPQITPAMVTRALALSASYHPKGGYNTAIGFGMINPLGALHEASTLIKVHTTAATGPTALAASAHMGDRVPATIRAVPLTTPILGGIGAAVAVGLLLLALAVRARRRYRASRAWSS
ncbi:MAG: S8 family serine peptidase [Actinobacteria bacterium]|nr:S8 family serine peptidase [Actinomycetota bacterium]MBO0832294.1 S8 family serine peptidase [Actinomycetota bacterium]MBO0836707.1 S8 family serine peptidase [Actinomycetota bacterium]